ncbi:hypothetical protein HDZ31DRAFT_49366 [Schizophyllum fasciatum]
MTDRGSRRSPRTHTDATPTEGSPIAPAPAPRRAAPAPRTRRSLAPSPLSLPPAAAALPTPLPSLSTEKEPSALLPAAHIPSPPAHTPAPIAPGPCPDSPLSSLRSSPSAPASPTSSCHSDDMPVSELAPGITLYAPGKLPTVEDSRQAAQSLADPRNCIRLASKIRAYAKAHNLEDGSFMESAINAFESPKMLGDLRQAAARLQLSLTALTFAQLETVLKAAFLRGTSTAFVDNFRALTRLPSESPHDFMDRIEETNFVLPEDQHDSQEEIIRRTSMSFSSGFKNFCLLNSQFKDLTSWPLPDADENDELAVRTRDASIGNFKDTLDLAWSLHVSDTSDRATDLQSAIDAVLTKRGITADSRKRGLSAASHSAQLPEPKRAPSFGSNSAHSGLRDIPLMPGLSMVNAVGYGQSSRPRNDLRGHRETLKKYNGCFVCFMLFADHAARDCPSTVHGIPFVPPDFNLDSAGVVQIIENQLLPSRIRNVTLADLTARVHRIAPHAAATAPNNIPVANRVNAVPAQGAYISPDASYEDTAPQPSTVNMIRYTPDDMSRSYASTGLAGRVTHIANVRGRLSNMAAAAVRHFKSRPGYVRAMLFKVGGRGPSPANSGLGIVRKA